MSIWLHSITTAVPDNCYTQEEAARSIAEWTADPHDRRLAKIAHKVSGIDKRHSVLASFTEGFFNRDGKGNLVEPGTGARNTLYRKTAIPLTIAAVEQLFKESSTGRSAITHLITVSCTGFFNPGIDYHLVQACGLPENVQRYHLGFMGCYAAINALHMAQQFCEADEQAEVLVVCTELCSLHLKPNAGRDAILANALFADGTAACIVGSRKPDIPAYKLGQRASRLLREGAADMAWDIGDLGFDMVLSSYVPKLLAARTRDLVESALQSWDLTIQNIGLWAIHPGGKAIIDEVKQALELSREQVASSREILRNFGNMSSATILFVLKEIITRTASDARVCAMAFGPGLTVELYQMELVKG
jgi:predicted naringenin-chalcone synthase